ncbi:ABC transporter substrate-binding protein [Nocardia puris]|uniref:NitT/TauT family transport system substrate-binding protein n=1 Tax=Nocardia puris TaxID=208602 RepID=A0A366E513_9NOCA|nr:ABC transporter substrate-binding protein [Nocardia puris]MBF6212691.1 ABC transporter substrate-binding protein [Nocardia puris]MBF6367629.1 ABC transporter substrate-binding protein [Nocardia puris]MBF6461280.1 ABC transporter substrate-binding protein [Nocardia puris]RBO96488.1 NitT/TauT family transport system substrate-binding protein [Nocardia puris]
MRNTRIRAAALLLGPVLAATLLAGCGSGGDDGAITVNVGYQSKTINTVTAGTLLRDRGTFEAKLAELGAATGVTYRVEWKDFASGPPLTAQMLAGQVDIGSMGDAPLLVNGSKTRDHADVASALIAVTGYNLRGSLNQVVVPRDSPASTLADLRGEVVSTSVGSAAHGMLATGLSAAGLTLEDVKLLGQDPPVGASALQGAQVAALAQFVPWPQTLVFDGKARLLYDGGSAEIPTFHGVVAGKRFGEQHPAVVQAFLAAQRETTDYLNANPLEAAQRVAEITGIPAEVVYLYNGPNGLVSFDPTIKQPLVEALGSLLPFLQSLGALADLDLGRFVDDSHLRALYGADYDLARDSTAAPSPLAGTDPVCGGVADDPATASEVWFAGQDGTTVTRTPACLLRLVAERGGDLRAAYVPDAGTGLRIFATAATWVHDPAAAPEERLRPFAVAADARAYADSRPGSTVLEYADALRAR